MNDIGYEVDENKIEIEDFGEMKIEMKSKKG